MPRCMCCLVSLCPMLIHPLLWFPFSFHLSSMCASANTEWSERTRHLISFTVGSHTLAQTSLNVNSLLILNHTCKYWTLSNLCYPRFVISLRNRRQKKAQKWCTCYIAHTGLSFFFPCDPAHGEIIVWGSFICCVRTQRAGEFFKAQASRTCIRSQSGSSVMQRCGRYPQGLALLDMEMRVGGIWQAH